MTLESLKTSWQDTEEYHKHIHEMFIDLVNKDEVLNKHRTWVENNIWGFGERSFHYFWNLLLGELPENPKIIEIGCFRGQTLSLFKLLRPDAKVFGVTPMSVEGGMWESDYKADIERIHDEFALEHPAIFPYLSEDERAIKLATENATYSLTYVDGGHLRRHIDNDLKHYAPLVEQSGYLVIDDAACHMKMPWGYFQGIQEVTDGVLDYMKEHPEWEFMFNVVHLCIYKRK